MLMSYYEMWYATLSYLCKSIPAGFKEWVRKIECYLFQLREVSNDLSKKNTCDIIGTGNA